jgi:hypothetical protein
MVKNITYFLICTIVISLVFLCGCWPKNNNPPSFDPTGIYPDSICKNGYRIYNLDTLVEDLDSEHPDSLMRWSILSGPLLTTGLIDSTAGNFVKIKPLRNQIGTDWVDFIVTDPSGLSASKVCSVLVYEPDFIMLLDTITMKINRDTTFIKNLIINYGKFSCLKQHWDTLCPAADTLLTLTQTNSTFTIHPHGYRAITGVYFEITDTFNHVTFNHSTLVTIDSTSKK